MKLTGISDLNIYVRMSGKHSYSITAVADKHDRPLFRADDAGGYVVDYVARKFPDRSRIQFG